jgi:hypothetical protein
MRNGNRILPIPVDGGLKDLIKQAARRTRLSQAAVMRSALRIGLPEVVKRLEGRKNPERAAAAADAFLSLCALVKGKRNREMVKPYKLP